MRLLVTIVLVWVGYSSAEKLTFHNYSVYSLTPLNEGAVNILRDWEEYRYNDFNFWSSVTIVNRSVEVMVPPHLKGYVEQIVNTMGMTSKIYMENVQEHIDRENVKPTLRVNNFGWTQYHTLDEVRFIFDSVQSTGICFNNLSSELSNYFRSTLGLNNLQFYILELCL